MYLRIRGRGFTETIFKEIGAITNGAILHFRDVVYDEESKSVLMPIERPTILPKRGFLGIRTIYRYDREARIKSNLIVRNVAECKIEDNSPEFLSRVQLIFGLGFAGNRIFAGSAEEDHGKTIYAIDLITTELDLEICDESENATES